MHKFPEVDGPPDTFNKEIVLNQECTHPQIPSFEYEWLPEQPLSFLPIVNSMLNEFTLQTAIADVDDCYASGLLGARTMCTCHT